jgi:hypothetical protein
MDMIKEYNGFFGGFAPNALSSFLLQKSTKKPAPDRSPGVPLYRAFGKIFQLGLGGLKHEKSLKLRHQNRSIEIILMGPDRIKDRL